MTFGELAAATRRPLESAAPLAGRFFVAPEVFELEQRQIFGRLWLAAAREDDLAAPGAFLTRTAGLESVLFTRDEGARLHAHFNVCRHRGARLVEEACGRRTRVQCPYHAWTYGLDGRLLGAPRMDGRAGFRKQDNGLVPVAVASWQGFVFCHLGAEPAPLSEQLADAPRLEGWSLPSLRRAAHRSYTVRANWKLLAENYAECYHCALVHPQLHRISSATSGGQQLQGSSFVGGPMRMNPGFDTMSTSGHSERASLPGLTHADHTLVHYYHLYPNLFLSLHRDYVMSHTLWPASHDVTAVECEWLFHPDEIARTGFCADDAVEFWDLTNRQDWEVCEASQRGVGSRGYRPAAYQDGEGCVHLFDNWYLDRMGL